MSLTDTLIDRLLGVVSPHYHKAAKKNLPIILSSAFSDGLNEDLDSITFWNRLAYILSTAEGESGMGTFMTEIWGPTDYQKKYDTHPGLGNLSPGEGYKFRGRGFCQITGRINYQKFSGLLGIDLIEHPEVLEDPLIASLLMIRGMRHGWFTGRSLGHYIFWSPPHVGDPTCDFYEARRVINGVYKAQEYAARAERYNEVLLGVGRSFGFKL